MDGSLSRMRGKADFRLMRELLGLPQEWVAKRVGVDARTVRNWESPRYFYPPKREAWDLVEGLWRRADAKTAGLVEIASSAARVARERGVEPAPLMLAYWRDAAQWTKAHPADGDAGMWRIENAAARLAADRLHAMGLPVAIAYAEPEA